MKNLLLVFSVVFLVLFSCVSETENLYIVNIKNVSSHPVNIKYYKTGILINEVNLQQNESSSNCEYVFETLSYYAQCYDSIIVRFPNNKGYINSLPGSNNLNFTNNRNLFGNGFTEIGNNTFQFEITEEDYLNAHDLP